MPELNGDPTTSDAPSTLLGDPTTPEAPCTNLVVWRAAALAGVISAFAGVWAGNELGTVSTKRELSACVGIELASTRTPADVKPVIDHCFAGEDLEMARVRLIAKIDELTGKPNP